MKLFPELLRVLRIWRLSQKRDDGLVQCPRCKLKGAPRRALEGCYIMPSSPCCPLEHTHLIEIRRGC